MGVGAPSVGDMTEFGAVEYATRVTFHGPDCSKETFLAFEVWLARVNGTAHRPIFISDNPAYDFQWINFYFWKHLGRNPFGHSARRIGDFYAGLTGDFRNTQRWKRFRETPHDHHPVHDALGNVEAFAKLMAGAR